jgi:Ca-activated chloride channel family protein
MQRLVMGAMVVCLSAGCGAGGITADHGAARDPDSSALARESRAAARPIATETRPLPGAVVASERQEIAQRDNWIGAEASSSSLLAAQREQLVAVWVDVPQATARAHLPTAVVLTIDTSASMQGDKIASARDAAKRLVGQLKDGDLVALHTFSDQALARVGPTRLDEQSRARIEAIIDELGASGSTNLSQAIERAEAQAVTLPASHPVRRIVVVSDGRATVGPSSPELLGQLAQSGVAHGVQVTALGVGLDYDEQTLNELAVRSSGRLYHLADARELPSILERELSLLESTMATGAIIEIQPAPGIQLVSIDGVAAAWSSGGGLRVPLGTLFAGQNRELVVRVRVSDESAGSAARPLLSARLSYADPAEHGIARIQEAIARAEFTRDPAVARAHAHPRAFAIVATQHAARLTAQAAAEANAGDVRAAEQHLGRAVVELEAGAAKAQRPAERQRIVASAARIEKARRALGTAASAPPAQRPSMVRKSALDANDASLEMRGF